MPHSEVVIFENGRALALVMFEGGQVRAITIIDAPLIKIIDGLSSKRRAA